jgi:hypothetical protein
MKVLETYKGLFLAPHSFVKSKDMLNQSQFLLEFENGFIIKTALDDRPR